MDLKKLYYEVKYYIDIKINILLTAALLLFCLAACSKLETNDKDICNISENSPHLGGIELFNNAMELEINTTTKDITLTPDSIRTNSTKITVTADNISSDSEIEVFLYLSDDIDHYIATTILTNAKKTVDFTNLTSSEEYKIGAAIKNASETTLLKITD